MIDGINVGLVEEKYNGKYVGRYDLPDREGPFWVFYTDNPDRSKGHDNYFGFFMHPISGDAYVTSAASIRKAKFAARQLKDGGFIVSRFRHDYQTGPDGEMLDGGLCYTRCSAGMGPTHVMQIVDGKEVFTKIFPSSQGMAELVKDMTAFHTSGDQPVLSTPQIPPKDRIKLRKRLIDEENKEFKDAIAANDIVGVADALGDLAYVIVGAACEFGIDLAKVWAEIQRSNMSKFDPVTGKAIHREDGKVLKGPAYTPPDIAGIIAEQLREAA